MGRVAPPVCAVLRAEMTSAAATAAKPMPHVAANARRVNAAGDGCAMPDGIALAAEPPSRSLRGFPQRPRTDQIVELRRGWVEDRSQIETRQHRGQANRDDSCRCRNTSRPTITRLTTLAPTPAANAGP